MTPLRAATPRDSDDKAVHHVFTGLTLGTRVYSEARHCRKCGILLWGIHEARRLSSRGAQSFHDNCSAAVCFAVIRLRQIQLFGHRPVGPAVLHHRNLPVAQARVVTRLRVRQAEFDHPHTATGRQCLKRH